MNADRRKKLDVAKSQIEEIRDEESDAFWAMGEGLQASVAGQRTEENIGYLEAALNELDSIE